MCPVGFWKNCTAQWPAPYAPAAGPTLGSIFDLGGFPTLASKTLHAGLSLKGGSGLQGAAQILLRAASAALLNAAKDIGYPLSTGEIVAAVNAALDGSRADMIALAGTLDGYNNLGCRDTDGSELPCKVK